MSGISAQQISVVGLPDSMGLAQTYPVLNDTIGVMADSIHFSKDEAFDYLDRLYSNSKVWKDPSDLLRQAIERLLFESKSRSKYSSEQYIRRFNWDVIRIPVRSFFEWDTIHIRLGEDESDLVKPVSVRSDTAFLINDVLVGKDVRFNRNVMFGSDLIIGDNFPDRAVMKPGDQSGDSIILVIRDTLKQVLSTNPEFPFVYYNFPNTGDSIKAAINKLTSFIEKKDTSVITFTGSEYSMPVLMSHNSKSLSRLWLKNEWDEDISVWIGSRSRDTVDVMVENGVHFRRPDKRSNIAEATVEVKTVDNSRLAEIKQLDVKPQYWKFFSEAAFVFNQAVIKNWVKGGESNISVMLDVTGTANYDNVENKTSWSNQGRFKFGIMASPDYGVRKNIDQIDLVSKYNQKAFGKFEFSATMLLKTQAANGYKYLTDTSYIVSKFFNPGSITLGLGLEYKPNKNLAVNFAPLSYKGTFVPDTSLIDQTKYGIATDRKARHEPGMSCQISHKMTFWKDVNITNKVALFTNYIDNPLNIDIDWELIATAKLNWFTDIRLNTHLIYDDNTLIPVFDKDREPVLGTDGKQKKSPNVQFKEVIGLSVIFRF